MLFALVLRKGIQYGQSENRSESLMHCNPSITCMSLKSTAMRNNSICYFFHSSQQTKIWKTNNL